MEVGRFRSIGMQAKCNAPRAEGGNALYGEIADVAGACGQLRFHRLRIGKAVQIAAGEVDDDPARAFRRAASATTDIGIAVSPPPLGVMRFAYYTLRSMPLS